MKFYNPVRELHDYLKRRHRSKRIPDRFEGFTPESNPAGVPPEVLARWMKGYPHTPDFADLETHQHHLLFAYGDEQAGCRANGIFEGVKPLYREAYTANPYTMVKSKDGQRTFPIVLDPPQDSLRRTFRNRRAPIKGQVFQLTVTELKDLDIHRENTVEFNRIRVPILIPHFRLLKQEVEEDPEWEQYTITECLYWRKRMFMYLGNFEHWNHRSLAASSHLLRERPLNQGYFPRYVFSRND